MVMEVEEIEGVLEKIWDLHDKLSDAIHSISRSHFFNSIKSLQHTKKFNNCVVSDVNYRNGVVFTKDFRSDADSAVLEAKSLNAIRTALENLEDQLEFFHTVQTQQRAERDAAIARLEQSRIVLAMRLAEHQGKKYKVIDEALAFVGDVHDAARFVSPENPYASDARPSGKNFESHNGRRSNVIIKFFVSSFNFAKKSVRLDNVGGILGNAAVFALSMIALLHLHQVACKDKYILDIPQRQENVIYNRNLSKVSRLGGSSSNGLSTHLDQLDVLLARG